ncbi:MAG: signal peptidase I [Actinomycetota bacterium]
MRVASRTIGKAISRLLLAGAVGVLVLLGFGPRLGTYRTLTVLTGSMRPGIPAGSIVIATPISPYSIKLGDIIIYQAPVQDRHVVMHRVVQARQIKGSVVIHTKGDANASPDPWSASITDRVAWKVRGAIPYAGKLLIALRSKSAHMVLVILLPFSLAGGAIRKIWKKPQPKQRNGQVVPG